jgi:hypothetical protein
MKFKIKHLGNLLVRFFTKDKYYVCEECHKIHKRNGKEIRLEEGGGILLTHHLWYGSVDRECFNRQQEKVWRILRERMLSK